MSVHSSSVADPGFSGARDANPKVVLFCNLFAENCMKMKEFGPEGPLGPPMVVSV